MDNNDVQLVGGPCGQHGPYTFYKAFKYSKDGAKRIITLSEFFFVKLWMDSDLLCIGELQLLWIDKNSEQVLASLRLYFLPENTPEGRMDHGEDEVLAISEKVVLRVEDLITWITIDAEWSWGRLGKHFDADNEIKTESEPDLLTSLSENSLDFSDVEKERKQLDIKDSDKGPSVVILSYPRYCRYRAVMKRLEGVEDDYLKHRIANALGGFGVSTKNTRILFCRDTFDYPELEGHELLCNHLAPKLKGRPRGKRKKRSQSPGSESNESECSITNINNSTNKLLSEGAVNGLRTDTIITPRRSTRAIENNASKLFVKKLAAFMKSNQTPIGRIPSLGYKELDLFAFYTKVQKLGGYDAVTTNRLWKSIFDDLSGNQASTSAATVIRRHYERFLLPYERHLKGEEYKPLPVSERRRLKSKTSRNSASDVETSEGTSRSGNSTPVPQLVNVTTPSTSTAPVEIKEPIAVTPEKSKPEVKPSSLRSVRVKPERLRDQAAKEKAVTITKVTEEKTENNNIPLKLEPVEIKPIITISEKNNEPITTAATPVQKSTAEKSPSPAEAKESLPIFDASDGTPKEPIKQIIDIPFKPNSPEVIDLDSDTYKNISSNNNFTEPMVVEIKKQKLDILKQGGLEVTPVCNLLLPQKDSRPSVIHQAVTPHRVEIIPNDKRQMPPPVKHTVSKRQAITIPKSPQVSPKLANGFEGQNTFSYINGQSPPKVVQSKSIYSPSEKTVYGDPKEIFAPQIHQIQAPKFVETINRHPGGGILDLTVKSPQKPAVEILQIPSSAPVPFNLNHGVHRLPYGMNRVPSLPLLDGRKVGSNLEITLVGPNSKMQPVPKLSSDRYGSVSMQPNKYTGGNSIGRQKRSVNENSHKHKVARVDEKLRPTYPPQMYQQWESKKSDFEANVVNSYFPKLDRNAIGKVQSPMPLPSSKQYGSTPPMFNASIANYLSQVTGNNKSVPPFVPVVDPLYYSALQRMYSPLFPVPTAEQLQFYTDLMTHNSRVRYPFPFTQDGNSSLTSIDNNMKKQ